MFETLSLIMLNIVIYNILDKIKDITKKKRILLNLLLKLSYSILNKINLFKG